MHAFWGIPSVRTPTGQHIRTAPWCPRPSLYGALGDSLYSHSWLCIGNNHIWGVPTVVCLDLRLGREDSPHPRAPTGMFLDRSHSCVARVRSWEEGLAVVGCEAGLPCHVGHLLFSKKPFLAMRCTLGGGFQMKSEWNLLATHYVATEDPSLGWKETRGQLSVRRFWD